MNIFQRKMSAIRNLYRKYHVAPDSTKHYSIRMLETQNGTIPALLLRNTNLLLENNKLLKEMNERFCENSVYCKMKTCNTNIVYTDVQLTR